MERYRLFQRIAEIEFQKIVSGTDDLGQKLRIYLVDKSFVDVFLSTQSAVQRFSFHWERQHIDKTIYRLDNTPDPKWKAITGYPLHFHQEAYGMVVASPFSTSEVETLFREFMRFMQKKMKVPLPRSPSLSTFKKLRKTLSSAWEKEWQ